SRRCRRGKGPHRRQRRISREIPCRASSAFSLCFSEASQRERRADEHRQRHRFQAGLGRLVRGDVGPGPPSRGALSGRPGGVYRSVFALIPVVLVYAWRGELAAVVRTERPLGQAGRGVLSIAGMFFNFGAVARLPLVESNAIAFSSP